MKKNRSIGGKVRFLSYILAVSVGLLQPCTVLGKTTAEKAVDSAENVKYITAFEELSEDDSYFSCMYKPTAEELKEVFPETLSVQLEGEKTASEITVTWECEDDFDASDFPLYIFYPEWDETKYTIADSVKDTIELPSITVEVPAGLITDLKAAESSLQDILEDKSILALVYLCDQYEVKKSASDESADIATVTSGQSVLITGVDLDAYGNIWYQVSFYRSGTEYTGYVERDYLATSDEDFAQWEEEYINFAAMPMVMALSDEYPDIEQFPASYQNALYALKKAHPNWTFVKMDTGLDWNTVIANEMGEKSLIISTSSGSWQNGTYGQGWSYASEGILKYYMDPRNFLTDPAIFQFEQLTYNDSYHTTEAVQEILKSSFMSSTIPGDSQTYAQVFQSIGKSLGISPFHLASRVLQEQGTQGTSPLISGTYSGYEGYYNYFNVGASGKTNLEVILSGLQTAKERGWNTRFKSLQGGSSVIGANYITKGQDTLYLEKFNVSNGQYANYTHQYMQNIQAPTSEATSVRKAYYNAGALDNSFVFKIPVYKNMPSSACSKPDTTDSLTLDKTSISDLEVDKTATLTPYINGSKVDSVSDMEFTSSNPEVAEVDSQGKITALKPGTATITCSRSGANTASCTVTVIKATPSVTTPTLSPVTYKEGLTLSNISLPEGWAWEKSSTAIKAGTFSYPAVYTPSDTTRYNKVTREISFTVTKAIPSCQVPENLTAKTGSKLESIALPDGFVWESDTETELKEAGEYIFYASYNPDENSYYTVSHIPIVVQVIGDAADDEEEDDDNMSSGGTGNGSTSSGNTGNSESSDTGSGSTGSGSGDTGSGSTGSGDTSGGSTSNGSTGSGNTGNGSGDTSSGNTGNSGSSDTSSGSVGNTGSDTNTSGSTNTTQTNKESNSNTGSNTESNSNTSTETSVNVNAGASSGTSSNVNTDTGTGTSGSANADTSSESGSNANADTSTESNSNASAGANSESGSNANANSNTESNADLSTASTSDLNTGLKTGTGANGQSTANSGTTVESQTVLSQNDLSTQSQGTEESSQESAAYTKPTVTIQMDDTTILTAEKLQMAQEQNFALELDMGNQAVWNIDAASADTAAFTAVDMGITFGTDDIPAELIAELAEGNDYLQFTLAHDGPFGFDVVLAVTVGTEYCGKYANLFYYNEENTGLEFICASLIDAEGKAYFEMDHASSYVIIISDQPMSGMAISDSKTGIVKWIVLGVVLLALLAAIGWGVFLLWRKKQEEDAKDADREETDEIEEMDEEGVKGVTVNGIGETGNTGGKILAVIKVGKKKVQEAEPEAEENAGLEKVDINAADEEDWIEDKDWQEPAKKQEDASESETAPETKTESEPEEHFANVPEEDDWIDDDEWDIGNDWIDDEEWENRNPADKGKA